MKTLLLLRHAKSSWGDDRIEDHERPLDARGERAAAVMGVYLSQQRPCPSLILCSSARRTQETLAAVRCRLEGDVQESIERELYLASLPQLLERIAQLENDTAAVLVIGHNPGIAELAVALAGSGPEADLRRMRAKFPTAALAAFALEVERWSQVRPGCGRLTHFTTPKDLV